ncbi:MAG: FHA domain-containing protein [Kofleriaceae bacterium]
MTTPALIAIISGGSLLLVGLVIVLARRSRPTAKRLCGGCQRAMLQAWGKCPFCGWVPMARLDFILGPLANQSLPLYDEVTTIGSVAGNTVVLADPAVSRKHAGIRRIEGIFELADLGSTNGVYVNGHKVPKKTLAPGDVIRVGNTEAIFKRE